MDQAGIVVTGATRVIFMIGTPIAQVRSPVLFNRYFAEHGVDRVMVPLDVSAEALPYFVRTVRDASNCDGFVATLPHKRALLELVDEVSETARQLESVNVVRRDADGRLFGDMADGAGFWNGAEANGFDPKGKSIVLAGAGAAGSAIAYEFARRGGSHVAIWSANEAEASALQVRLAPTGVAVTIGMPASLDAFDMAVNATPVGMRHAPGSVFSSGLIATLPAHAIVADAITDPVETQLLGMAAGRGLATINGHAMTLGQFGYLLKALNAAASTGDPR
ncbi:shikimate dehydrogenase family protein [Aliihoeflea sp. PC F10.4]